MFYCKRVGAFSRDYEVYRDEACEEEKWMVIDTEGSIFDDNAYIAGELFALRASPPRRRPHRRSRTAACATAAG